MLTAATHVPGWGNFLFHFPIYDRSHSMYMNTDVHTHVSVFLSYADELYSLPTCKNLQKDFVSISVQGLIKLKF